MDATNDLEMGAGRVGQTVGRRYRLLRLLGVGGMGAVYEAEQTSLGKRVALKMLHRHCEHDRDVVRRFQQEARAAARLDHPNIVEVYDLDLDLDGAPFLVMELLRGQTLASVLTREGTLSIAAAVRIALAVADALAAAHGAGIVHRDLKPENVFLATGRARELRVKVLDFGISKVRSNVHVDHRLTRTGMALGTPAYMSPEQAQASEHVDARADVWGLGVLLYEALAGCPPFRAGTPVAQMISVITDEAPPLGLLRPDVPAELEHIVHECLRKSPDERIPSMRALAAALAPFAEERSGAPHVGRRGPQGRSASPRAPSAPTVELSSARAAEPPIEPHPEASEVRARADHPHRGAPVDPALFDDTPRDSDTA
jgi:serine/threonine protein kinase